MWQKGLCNADITKVKDLNEETGRSSWTDWPTRWGFKSREFLLLESERCSTRASQGETRPTFAGKHEKVAAASKTKTGTWLTASKKTGASVGRPTESQVQPIIRRSSKRILSRSLQEGTQPCENLHFCSWPFFSPTENISLIRFHYEKCLNENMTAINSPHLHKTKCSAELLIVSKTLKQDWALLCLHLFVCTCTPKPS